MVTLYRTADSPFADEVEDVLQEIVIAHEVDKVASSEDVPFDADGQSLPILVDDDVAVSGEEPIRAHLDELRSLMADWDRFQSDSCYIEDDGSIC